MSQKIVFRLVKSIWLIACFISFQQIVPAQNAVTIKGQVFDKTSNLPLSYASVCIPNSGTGVITNEFGEFNYHLPENSDTDSVQISFIGYKKIYLKVTSIKPDVLCTFGMEPEIKNIEEVQIKGTKGTPASMIVKRAIRSFYKNYPRTDFLVHGYYRDYIKDKSTNDFKNLTEAAVIIEDRGFNKLDYKQSKIKLEQIRYNPGFKADNKLNSGYNNKTKYVPNSSYKEANELAILRLHDPIRNHNRKTFSFVYVFDDHFIPNHSFSYESIINDGFYKIYEISFETYCKFFNVSKILETHSEADSMSINNAKTEYRVKGKIYIHSKSYAILKFTYTVTCKLPSYSGKFFDLNLEYKNYDDKYFLNYLSMCNYFEFKTDTSSLSPVIPEQYFQYRELFVNKIVTPPFNFINQVEAIRKNTTLNSNKVPIIQDFWINYNYTNYLKLIE